MPQTFLYKWKIIFSGSLLHKTPTPWVLYNCDTQYSIVKLGREIKVSVQYLFICCLDTKQMSSNSGVRSCHRRAGHWAHLLSAVRVMAGDYKQWAVNINITGHNTALCSQQAALVINLLLQYPHDCFSLSEFDVDNRRFNWRLQWFWRA